MADVYAPIRTGTDITFLGGVISYLLTNDKIQHEYAVPAAWGGADIPGFKADEDPTHGMGPFIMNPEGVARFFARRAMNEGPFPEHYEPMETPLAKNPLSPGQPLSLSNPAARVFDDDRKAFGKSDKFPHAGTTYRLTEHFHFWTKHARMNAIIQPEQFVEIEGCHFAALPDSPRDCHCENGTSVVVM